MSEALKGGCLCGAARFTAKPQKMEMDVCHCRMCQKWSGGVFMAVPCTEVTLEDETQFSRYVSSDWAERLFCKSCGSSLLWRMRDGSHAAVSMQGFDDPSRFAFTEEIFIDEKPETYRFADATRKMTGPEVVAAFAAGQDS
ncbi:GFA family protein [Aurantimonas marianensis]|uniref:GFA family protein n=1 Tax=Aurantimonas marianensis TaxID=2920428 RepID=A0A9X2H7R8_9HYPH|nr:GFA family protein [Aurantimonas marianensis]MCP3055288.1 GFA family protein [Aurantimonas marianensis]